MTFSEFTDSLTNKKPPLGIPRNLEALWHDAVGDWDKAHIIVQETGDELGDLIHAYLHRKEGDKANAAYWYHRTGRTMPTTRLEEEWKALASIFLTNEITNH